jgi:hypothetical protein
MQQLRESLPTSHQDDAIAHYLETGEYDVYFSGWDGDGRIERAQRGAAELKAALLAEIRRRTSRATVPPEIRDLDPHAFARRKLTPMVSGLFPEKEQEPVLRMFERSIVFLTPDNIEQIITDTTWLSTAWELANVYLGSVGATALGNPDNEIVGLSEETTCYVSMEYFKPRHRFTDFVVHEAAHVFHNCKRRTIGLRETRRREWLLDIEYRKRETFAYACEAYSRILELGSGRREQLALVDEFAGGPMPSDERIDPAEYLDILREAATARNGWKRILTKCSPRLRNSVHISHLPSVAHRLPTR